MVGIDSSSPRLRCLRETTLASRLLHGVCPYTLDELSEAFCVPGFTKRVVSGSNRIKHAFISYEYPGTPLQVQSKPYVQKRIQIRIVLTKFVVELLYGFIF